MYAAEILKVVSTENLSKSENAFSISSNLSFQFVNVIECSVHRCNSVRMTSSCPIYEVEHSANVSPQLLLRHIPVCGEYLVGDKVTFGCHLEFLLPVWNL